MALFPSSPDDAVRAAVSMQRAVAEYNEERERDGFNPIGIGVGLHLADLMLGIIGSRDRMQGAVVADAVNLAARIYLKRCANYMVSGVPPDWTGVETLLEK